MFLLLLFLVVLPSSEVKSKRMLGLRHTTTKKSNSDFTFNPA